MHNWRSVLAATFAFGLSISLVGEISLAAEPPVGLAPVNPAFSAFLAAKAAPAPARLLAAGEEVHPTGYIPSPVNRSHLKGQQQAAEAAGLFAPARYGLPLSYDLRSQGKLTAVRDQGSCGDCWAFAAMGSVESVLMPGETRDFSENNLKNRHGFDWGDCDGGNGDISTAYFARRDGPVNETDDPYNVYSNVSPAGLSVQKVLTKAVIIPPRANSTDNDAIKQAIMDYGAVQSSYYASSSSSYYRAATFSYYYNGGGGSNHAITLVGWDDNYDKSNFAITPPGNGAYIVRNSWGAYWGQSGYFYLSYYDTNIGDDNYQFRSFAPGTAYTTIYQYDPLGQTSGVGYGSDTAWFANIFTATGAENITGIGIPAASVNSTCDWYIYTGVSPGVPRSGTLAASGTGVTLPTAGYQVVPVAPVAVTNGQRFSVVVRLTTPGYTYPIPLERPFGGYSMAATAAAGQSYMGSNGTIWSDLTSSYANTNVALKALSQYAVAASVSGGNGTVSSANPAYTGTGGSATFTLAPDSGYVAKSTVTGSCPSGSFNGNSYTIGAITGNCTAVFSFQQLQPLTLSATGGGSISALPSPPGGVCPPACSQSFFTGEIVTLTANPAPGATFSNWGGDCTGSGACQVTMSVPRSVSAVFAWEANTKDSGTGTTYGQINDAYAAVAEGGTLRLRGITFSEAVACNRGVNVVLKGGYDSAFTASSGTTTISGSLTISSGSITVENLAII